MCSTNPGVRPERALRGAAVWASAAIFCLLNPFGAAAAPGDSDFTLGGTGRLWVLAGGGADVAHAVARQSDGKLIVAGESDYLGTPVPSVARHLANGALDPTFGSGGKVLLTTVAGGFRAALVQSSTGKILLAGHAVSGGTNSNMLLVRLLADGTPDPSFIGSGVQQLDFVGGGGEEVANAIALQNDGRIVLVGRADGQHVVARRLPDGPPDTSFGTGGQVRSSTALDARDVFLQGTNSPKIVIAGYRAGNGSTVAAVVRYTADGTLDTTFSGDGIAENAAFPRAYGITLMAVLAGEEKFVVTGGREPGVTSGPLPVPVAPDFGLWSLDMATGVNDSAFGTAGTVLREFEHPGLAVRVQSLSGSPSRLLVTSARGGGLTVRRFRFDGSLDTAFGTGGTGEISPGGGEDVSRALLVQPDGRPVVVGASAGDFGVGRLTTGGSADTSFNGNGATLDDLGQAVSAGRAVVAQPNGRLLVGATGGVIRLLADGTFDTTFSSDGRAPVSFSVRGMAAAPSGRVVAVGSQGVAGNETPGLAILDEQGNFVGGATGFTTGAAEAVAVQPDGRIVVGATGASGGGARQARVLRFLPSGAADLSFGTAGEAVFPSTLLPADCHAVTLDSAGRIVACGSFGISVLVFRYLPDGTLDPTFGSTGSVFPEADGRPAAGWAIAMQGEKILVAGTVGVGNESDVLVQRLNANGSPDLTFNGTGVRVHALNATGYDAARALHVLPDGRFLVGGTTTGAGFSGLDYAVLRCLPDGTLDATFGTGGVARLAFGSQVQDEGNALAVDSLGRIVVTGGSLDRIGIARVLGEPVVAIASITRNPVGGTVTLRGLATPGHSAALHSTGDLRLPFASLQALSPAADGSWEINRAEPAAQTFYRVEVP